MTGNDHNPSENRMIIPKIYGEVLAEVSKRKKIGNNPTIPKKEKNPDEYCEAPNKIPLIMQKKIRAYFLENLFIKKERFSCVYYIEPL